MSNNKTLNKNESQTLSKFIDEVLLNSGQYALFYILMNFAIDGGQYFKNIGHSFLIVALILQTAFLVKFGHIPKWRFFGSLIASTFYAIFELREGYQFVLNTGHFFFWVFSFLTAFIQTTSLKIKSSSNKKVLEYLLTVINVVIFIFIYVYFDLKMYYKELLKAGSISLNDYHEALEFYHLYKDIVLFFKDSAHIYLVLGGAVLAVTLAQGRSKIIDLKDRLNELFGKYVDSSVRDKIMQGQASRTHSKKVCTVFSDIRNFTEISETSDPTKIVEALNLYFSEWNKVIRKHNGVIDKFIGDAVMIVFGLDDETSACEDAVACSLSMLGSIENFQEELRSRNLPLIGDIGVGINFGEVIVGDIGSPDRLNYTVIGDSVNTASRIEGLCKTKNSSLLIAYSVYSQISTKKQNLFKNFGHVEIRGKAEDVLLWGI